MKSALSPVAKVFVFALFILAFACTSLAHAAATAMDKDPIDSWLEKALEKESSTAGMRAATNKAREMWEKELNLSYQRVMKKIGKPQQTALDKSQQAWRKSRDAEGRAINLIFASGDSGSLGQLIATAMGMELVKARTLQLRNYEKQLNG